MTEVNHDRSGGGESCCICWSQSRLEVASWLFGATAITFSKFLDAMSRLSYNPMSARVKIRMVAGVVLLALGGDGLLLFPELVESSGIGYLHKKIRL